MHWIYVKGIGGMQGIVLYKIYEENHYGDSVVTHCRVHCSDGVDRTIPSYSVGAPVTW